jgi:hypothetical protein
LVCAFNWAGAANAATIMTAERSAILLIGCVLLLPLQCGSRSRIGSLNNLGRHAICLLFKV